MHYRVCELTCSSPYAPSLALPCRYVWISDDFSITVACIGSAHCSADCSSCWQRQTATTGSETHGDPGSTSPKPRVLSVLQPGSEPRIPLVVCSDCDIAATPCARVEAPGAAPPAAPAARKTPSGQRVGAEPEQRQQRANISNYLKMTV